MQAIIFRRAGEPQEVLSCSDTEAPVTSSHQVLVRVKARPVQPADLAFVRGQYRIRPSFPQTAGLEACGEVVRGGEPSFAPGSRVAFRNPGTWAEFAAIPSARLISVPNDVTDEIACQISLNPVSAWALLKEARAASQNWIVLTAATSTVSNIVGAIAKQRGIRTIGIARGDEARAQARCTADVVLSANRSSLTKDILEITGERGVNAVLDSVGGPLITQLIGALVPGGRIIAYGVQDRELIPVTNAMLVYSNLVWQGFGIDHWLSGQDRHEITAMFNEVWSMVRDGTIQLPVDSTYRLQEFQDALKANSANDRTGKVILVSP